MENHAKELRVLTFSIDETKKNQEFLKVLPKNFLQEASKHSFEFCVKVDHEGLIPHEILNILVIDSIKNEQKLKELIKKIELFKTYYMEASKLLPDEIHAIKELFRVSNPYNNFFYGINHFDLAETTFDEIFEFIEKLRISEQEDVLLQIDRNSELAKLVYAIAIRNKSKEILLANHDQSQFDLFDTIVLMPTLKNSHSSKHYGAKNNRSDILNEYVKSFDFEYLEKQLNRAEPNAHAIAYLAFKLNEHKNTLRNASKKLGNSILSKKIESSINLVSYNKNTLKKTYGSSPTVFEVQSLIMNGTLEFDKSIRFLEFLARENILESKEILDKNYKFNKILVLKSPVISKRS